LNRLVIDAGTLLSGIAGHPQGPSATLLNAVYERTVEAFACPMLIGEVDRNLSKPYFAARISAEDARMAVGRTEAAVTMLADPIEPTPILRDRTDDYLIALAHTAKAGLIVTGDKDLLDHSGLQPPAIRARAICELLWLIAPT
jgi:putative PIN family toxin of toxin-antitoxin system